MYEPWEDDRVLHRDWVWGLGFMNQEHLELQGVLTGLETSPSPHPSPSPSPSLALARSLSLSLCICDIVNKPNQDNQETVVEAGELAPRARGTA